MGFFLVIDKGNFIKKGMKNRMKNMNECMEIFIW